MGKILNSLQTKLTISFMVLILVVSGLSFAYTFTETKKALKQTLRDELQAIASVIAVQVDGEALAGLKPGDEDAAAFQGLLRSLNAMKNAHADIKYIYTMRKNGEDLEFLVDADYANEDDPGGKIGEKYEDTTETMFAGFSGPAVENEFSTDKWGTLLSGYAPIKDSQGDVIGIVGVDMTSDRVIEKQNFIGNTIYVIMGVGVLLAALFILLFSKTIIRDVKRLIAVAEEISMGNTNVVMNVSRKDEIGGLAESFGRMVASLKIMMMDQGSN